MMPSIPLFDRELSWLSFNERVLQEAEDSSVPLLEKIKFIAIFSSNLDEFFRVRVAALRNLLSLKSKSKAQLTFNPTELLTAIQSKVFEQQERLGKILREVILPQLAENNIHLMNDEDAINDNFLRIEQYFIDEIQPFVQPMIMIKRKVNIFLQNKSIYLAVILHPAVKGKRKKTSRQKSRYALVNIPSDRLSRFHVFTGNHEERLVFLLDDIIRAGLKHLFPGYSIGGSYAIKLTRDAEMYIDDEFSGDLLKKIKKGIARRKTGAPARFLYDKTMPAELLEFLIANFNLHKEDIVEGGRFHNFNDFFAFPNFGIQDLQNKTLPLLPSKPLEQSKDIFSIIRKSDVLLHYPYQSFDYVIRFLKQAANDPDVKEIYITLYRVAPHSQVIEQLVRASEYGKTVRVFIELKARFDEESNILGAQALENAGVDVFYSFPGLKVHAKSCLIIRDENGMEAMYAYLATGNFNEKTSRIYSDIGLFTADNRYTEELHTVFNHLFRHSEKTSFKNLLVAPFNMREKFNELIDREIEYARKGLPAGIRIKLNSLQDTKMIAKLYEASREGVKVDIIVRGICCLIPGIKDISTNIRVISIVDRYLEHARIYIFTNGGKDSVYIGSADWMKRNLSRRIEVIFPLLDQNIADDMISIFEIQWQDNVKSRLIDKHQKNSYRKTRARKRHQSQLETFDYLRRRNSPRKNQI